MPISQSLLRALTACSATLCLALCTAALAAADAFAIDRDHSSALFKVRHLGVSNFWGRFNDIDGTITLDADASRNSVTITIKTDSVDTRKAKLDEHLKSSDFFSVKEFPSLTFVSKTMTPTGDNTYEVAGNVTMHGVTRPLTVKVAKVGQGPGIAPGEIRAGFETTFTLKRSDFGMKFMLDRIGDEIEVVFSAEAIQKK